jgi:biotin operon repressor
MRILGASVRAFAVLVGLLLPVHQGHPDPGPPSASETVARTLAEVIHARVLLADRLSGILQSDIERLEEDELAIEHRQVGRVLKAARLADAPLSRRQNQLTPRLPSLDLATRDLLDALESGRGRVLKALQSLRELGVPVEDVEFSWWSTESAPPGNAPADADTTAVSGSIDDALSTVGTGTAPQGPRQ